ncbi:MULTISPECIES: phosphoglucosamine mutase [Aerococcus]|uniref:Phosphoglucosamine mutase n=1 Tax=Aerococcus sanguinicola TaxID=119206 RepID=A0A5N1GH79_9LACT|nr:MULTISPECIES: phosphoglucosamine mutase [Aerococcus]KAA9299281.1 phosphoglucosamine mutase [Aerococcus sanguinicola]MDK6370093.1 phosphoglucosamine mutase [Aerococcus sp. UMB9870]MDK6680697.1 phosphoglucosamine mutase [Aerococcus sp. UMB8608]MDK6687491.1 phosphoglucosamine mutase [Aerococcus sp. UMB8623]MDK6940647.1 phosphoglucosamine mutase [Aerococcus sp. UMB8487]
MRKYFGTDGVRGEANRELTPELAFKLGRCGGYVLLQHAGEQSENPRVLVARDPRISGQLLEHALISGLLSVGIEVFQLGVISTPGVAYLTRTTGATAGVMISASHNPAADNGIKFFGSDGFKLSDDQELEIEALLDQEEDTLPRPSSEGLGTVSEYLEGASKYLEFLESTITSSLEGINVCIDAANGATSPLVNRLFADLETNFQTMASSPDGLNINDGVGSTHPEALAQMVCDNQADVGIAFDGDGDRCLAVDEKGRLIDGDHIMFICGKYLNERGRLKDNTIVATVMSNLGFHKATEAAGIHVETTKVGDRYVVEAMREKGYTLGGEQSGHIIFMEHNTTGDGLLTAIQLLFVMKQTGKKLSELADEMQTYPQILVNVRVTRQGREDAMKSETVQEVIQAVEAEMGGDGRILVRPSGTENLLRVMVEAKTDDLAADYANRIADQVRQEFEVE